MCRKSFAAILNKRIILNKPHVALSLREMFYILCGDFINWMIQRRKCDKVNRVELMLEN